MRPSRSPELPARELPESPDEAAHGLDAVGDRVADVLGRALDRLPLLVAPGLDVGVERLGPLAELAAEVAADDRAERRARRMREDDRDARDRDGVTRRDADGGADRCAELARGLLERLVTGEARRRVHLVQLGRRALARLGFEAVVLLARPIFERVDLLTDRRVGRRATSDERRRRVRRRRERRLPLAA